MRALVSGLLLTLTAAGCTSMADAGGVGLIEPGIRVRQMSGQMIPRTDVVTDVNLQIDVFNQSAETIVLERVALQSTPTSEVIYMPASRQLHEVIPPGEVRTVDFWVQARLEARSSSGVGRGAEGGGVTVRGTAVFDSPVGKFRTVFIEPVVVFDSRNGPDS